MNRRDFCFSLGAAVVGGVAVYSAKCEARGTSVVGKGVLPASFRAKKIFPEQWWDIFGFDSASEQADMLQNSLRGFVGNSTALVVASQSGMSPEFLKILQTETLRAGLELYLPAGFPGEATYCGMTTEMIYPLQIFQSGIESAKLENLHCDGFLFSLSKSVNEFFAKPHGMFLCDTSRGTWQTFFCQSSIGRGDVSQGNRNHANLQTAQWLDFARKRVYGI